MMDSRDLSTNLVLGILTPAPADRAVEKHAANQDAQGNTRRRRRTKEDDEDLDDLNSPSQAGDEPAHQLDHLA
jgi:hypothetical protein